MPIKSAAIHQLFDEEHRQLFRMLEVAREVCPRRFSADACANNGCETPEECSVALDKAFDELMSFVLAHFNREEGLIHDLRMIGRDPPDFGPHIESHADIAETVVSAMNQRELMERGRQLIATVDAWLKDHIDKHDAILLQELDDLASTGAPRADTKQL